MTGHDRVHAGSDRSAAADHGMTREAAAAERTELDVDGVRTSYLTAGSGPRVLLLHGTYWSRVWLPVMADMAAIGLNPVAVDLPGLGRSDGELDLDSATIPELASWATRFLEALDPADLAGIAGHDIGGAIAQHLVIASPIAVPRYALVNSVTYDSWPVPGVAKYRDPNLVAATTVEHIVEARRDAVTTALYRKASEAEIADYLDPWYDIRVARSWMALAGAADSRYTRELVGRLQDDHRPKLLVWGEADTFQPLTYARRFADDMPRTAIEVIAHAGHIPMENDPTRVAQALGTFFNTDGNGPDGPVVEPGLGGLPVHGDADDDVAGAVGDLAVADLDVARAATSPVVRPAGGPQRGAPSKASTMLSALATDASSPRRSAMFVERSTASIWNASSPGSCSASSPAATPWPTSCSSRDTHSAWCATSRSRTGPGWLSNSASVAAQKQPPSNRGVRA